MRWWWIFVGGGLGSMCRVALGVSVGSRFGDAFPWGTLAANALGCLAIGAVAAWLDSRGGHHPSHPFLVAGFLGGFTTFSTFGLETVRLLESARPAAALLNALGSVAVGVVAVVVGFAVVRAVSTS